MCSTFQLLGLSKPATKDSTQPLCVHIAGNDWLQAVKFAPLLLRKEILWCSIQILLFN